MKNKIIKGLPKIDVINWEIADVLNQSYKSYGIKAEINSTAPLLWQDSNHLMSAGFEYKSYDMDPCGVKLLVLVEYKLNSFLSHQVGHQKLSKVVSEGFNRGWLVIGGAMQTYHESRIFDLQKDDIIINTELEMFSTNETYRIYYIVPLECYVPHRILLGDAVSAELLA